MRPAVGRHVVDAAILAFMFSCPVSAIAKDKKIGDRAQGPSEDSGKTLNWDMDASLTLVSDYRGNGVSNTDGKPAVQLEIDLVSKGGALVKAWASNVAPNGGADVEVDLSAGYSFNTGKVRPTLGMTAYVYPGAVSSNYVEFYNIYEVPIGDVTFKTGAAWAPKQAHLGRSNLYVGALVDVPVKGTPIMLEAMIGRDDGAFGDNKIDWSISATYSADRFDIGLSYVDTRHALMPYSGPTLVASLTGNF